MSDYDDIIREAVNAALAVLDEAFQDNRSRTPLGDSLAHDLHETIALAVENYEIQMVLDPAIADRQLKG